MSPWEAMSDPVIDPRDREGSVSSLEEDMFISEHPHLERIERLNPRERAGEILMVACDKKHPLGGIKRTERLKRRGELLDGAVDKISSDHDQLRVERGRLTYKFGEEFLPER